MNKEYHYAQYAKQILNDYLVDNTDPRHPIIKHDRSKIDKSAIADNLTTKDSNKVLSANQGTIIKETLNSLETALISEQNDRQTADSNLQGQITTLESVKASKAEMTEAIANAINAVVNSAPEAFDTLKEIADWIEQDEAGSAALVLRVSAIETKNTEQDTAIANEITARTNADNTLQSNIDTEANTRQSAVNALTNSKLDNVTIESGTNNGTLKITKVINGTSTMIDNIPILVINDKYKYENDKWYFYGDDGKWYYLGVGANPSVEDDGENIVNQEIYNNIFEKIEEE